MKKLIYTLLVMFFATIMAAQPKLSKINIVLVPDKTDAIYTAGEQAKVKIMVLHMGVALENPKVNYQISEDLMDPHKTGEYTLKGTEGTISMGTMKKPGYLRLKVTCIHDGKTYSSLCTVGYDPHKLSPTVKMPADFMEFWQSNKEKLNKVSLKPEMDLIGEKCTKDVNVYHISYGNINGTRMYGMLTMPAKDGKYPAILRFPGAGVGEKGGDIAHAAQGAIILELGIHGIPVNLKGSIYTDLGNCILANYPTQGVEDKDTYYYKRVYLGCVKGIDFLLSLPQCNGNVATFGGSQGGALSIATAAIDSRIKAAVAYFPALSDMEGYCHSRAGGWPHLFKNKDNRTKEILETAGYYDTANFARCLKAPVMYLYGYNDLTCAPTTTRATYNAIGSEKQLLIGENIGHWTYPEQMNALWNWIIEYTR